MKKHIFILLFIVKQLNVSADSLAVSRCYNSYNGISTGYTYEIDRYDSAGHFLSQNQIELINNPPQGYSYTKKQTLRFLNQFGNPVSTLSEEWNGNSWDTTVKDVYVYDNSQNLIADTTFDYTTNFSKVVLYEWDVNNDTLAVKHLYLVSGSSYQFGDSTRYYMNVNGLVDTYERYSGTPLIPVLRESYLYDASNHIINYTRQVDPGTGWENENQYLYSYDTSNRLTAYSHRIWNVNYWDVNDTSSFAFTPSGNIDHSMVSQTNGLSIDSTLIFNTYDASDSLIQVDQFKYFFPSNTRDSLRTIISRDPNGHVMDQWKLKAINGVYQHTELYHHDLSLLPDTERIFYMTCDSVACNDTTEFIIYTYFPGGHTYYIHHYTGGGQFVGGESYIIQNDSLGRTIYNEGNTWGPGNYGHGIGTWAYDANNNLIHHYTLGEGSLGIPSEVDCYYDFYPGTGTLAVNLMLDVSDTVCDGTPLPGFLLITGGMPPYQISWNDTTEILDANSLMPVFVPESQANFVVIITDNSGATATDSVIINSPSFVLDLGADTIACNGDTMNVIAPPGFSNYNWMSGTTHSNILQLYSATSDSITVYLNVMDTPGCVYSDTVNVIFDNCLGVEENPMNQPVVKTGNGSVTILFSEQDCPDNFSIHALDGRKIYSGKVDGCAVTINTSELTSGIYIFSYSDKQGNKLSFKIIPFKY